jgi:hypothetical protein
VSALALAGCGDTIDTIEDDVEAKLAPTTPVEDVDCAGYTEEDVPSEGTRLTCEAFRNDDEVHDPNDQVGEVTLTVGQDGSARFRRCKALTAPGPGPDC